MSSRRNSRRTTQPKHGSDEEEPPRHEDGERPVTSAGSDTGSTASSDLDTSPKLLHVVTPPQSPDQPSSSYPYSSTLTLDSSSTSPTCSSSSPLPSSPLTLSSSVPSSPPPSTVALLPTGPLDAPTTTISTPAQASAAAAVAAAKPAPEVLENPSITALQQSLPSRMRRSSLSRVPSQSQPLDPAARTRRSSLSRSASTDKSLFLRWKDNIAELLVQTLGDTVLHIDTIGQAVLDGWTSFSPSFPAGFTAASIRDALREVVLSDPRFQCEDLDGLYYHNARKASLPRRGSRKTVAASSSLSSSSSSASSSSSGPRPKDNSEEEPEDQKGLWICCDSCSEWVRAEDDGISDISVYDDSNPKHLDYHCPECRNKGARRSKSKTPTKDGSKEPKEPIRKAPSKRAPNPGSSESSTKRQRIIRSQQSADGDDDSDAEEHEPDNVSLFFKDLFKQNSHDKKVMYELKTLQAQVYQQRDHLHQTLRDQTYKTKKQVRMDYFNTIQTVESNVAMRIKYLFN